MLATHGSIIRPWKEPPKIYKAIRSEMDSVVRICKEFDGLTGSRGVPKALLALRFFDREIFGTPNMVDKMGQEDWLGFAEDRFIAHVERYRTEVYAANIQNFQQPIADISLSTMKSMVRSAGAYTEAEKVRGAGSWGSYAEGRRRIQQVFPRPAPPSTTDPTLEIERDDDIALAKADREALEFLDQEPSLADLERQDRFLKEN